jgi:hypothetical protein
MQKAIFRIKNHKLIGGDEFYAPAPHSDGHLMFKELEDIKVGETRELFETLEKQGIHGFFTFKCEGICVYID